MIASRPGGQRTAAVVGNPVAKCVWLAIELAVVGLLFGKLRLHDRARVV
jgi:hypothetical protein